MAASFPGRKAICGGTTANIISRLLNRPVHACLTNLDPEIPPSAVMEGVDLITEGTMTLARVAEMLERGSQESWPANAARDLMALMLQSDVVEFVVAATSSAASSVCSKANTSRNAGSSSSEPSPAQQAAAEHRAHVEDNCWFLCKIDVNGSGLDSAAVKVSGSSIGRAALRCFQWN